MKRLFNLKFWAVMLAGVALLTSCVSDEEFIEGSGPVHEQESEKLTIRISVPASSRPATRALVVSDEFAVNEITVLAFNASDKKFYGRYAGFVADGPEQIGSTAGATMTFQVSLPLGDFDLMVVANSNAMLNAASATLVKGAAQSAVEEAIKMSMGIDGWEDDPTKPGHFIPMWGYIKDVNVPEDFTGENTTLSSDIHLTRMVAKANLSLGTDLVTADKFELQTVRVYNYSKSGRLIPTTSGTFDWTAVDEAADLRDNTTPSLPTGDIRAEAGSNEYIDYTVADKKSLIGSIYLFEAPAGVSPVSDPDDYLENVCLVIGGSYNEGATTYYRIDFAKDTDTNPSDNVHSWQYLPLMRNNSYTITITDIKGDGHGTPGDALNSAPVNIETNILDWNNEDITMVITDQIYSLGVSQGAFEFAGPKITAAGDDNQLLIATDYSNGWSAEIFDTQAGTGTSSRSWLSLNTSGTSKVTQATADKDAGGTWMTLLTTDNAAASRTAYIRITAGGLVYNVKVVQTSVTSVLTVVGSNLNYTYAGGLQNFRIASYATGENANGEDVTGAISWKAEFSTDNGATWTTTAPDWVDFPTSGAGTANATQATIPVSAQRQTGIMAPNTENSNLQSAAERGTNANRWNLAGNAANGDLSGAATWQTANCYVVNSAGYYKLPLYFGNAYGNAAVAAQGATHSSVIAANGQITGADNATIVWQDAPDLVTNVAYDAGFLTFDVPKANIMQGNAVVAIRDASNKILWSWHIWVTPTSIFNVAAPATDAITTRAVSPTIEYTNYFMKYNLGYASPTQTNFAARSFKVRITQTGLEEGLETRTQTITVTQNAGTETTDTNNPHWQWGRKDPFPPSNGNNYTERTIYYGAGYSRVVSSGPATTIDEGIVNPHTFYPSNSNWLTTNYNDLWDLGNAANVGNTYGDNTVAKTIYDPSPVGFKMPPSNAFRGFTYTGNNYTLAGAEDVYSDFFNVSGAWSRGWRFYSTPNAKGATAGTPVFFPASGYRDFSTGALSNVSTLGLYWSALPSSATYGCYLFFSSGSVNPLYSANRSCGFSVRPVAE